jgi:hypothetical protein
LGLLVLLADPFNHGREKCLRINDLFGCTLALGVWQSCGGYLKKMLVKQLAEELKVLFARILRNQGEVDAQQFKDEIQWLLTIRVVLVWCHTAESCKGLSELLTHSLIWAIKEACKHKLASDDIRIYWFDKFVEEVTTVQQASTPKVEGMLKDELILKDELRFLENM